MYTIFLPSRKNLEWFSKNKVRENQKTRSNLFCTTKDMFVQVNSFPVKLRWLIREYRYIQRSSKVKLLKIAPIIEFWHNPKENELVCSTIFNLWEVVGGALDTEWMQNCRCNPISCFQNCEILTCGLFLNNKGFLALCLKTNSVNV